MILIAACKADELRFGPLDLALARLYGNGPVHANFMGGISTGICVE